MSNDIVRSAETIISEMVFIKEQAAADLAASLGRAKRSVFEIGRRLCELKELAGHGHWEDALARLDYSETTARNAMRIYKEMGNEQIDMITGKSDVEIFEGLSQSQLVELFPIPREERAAFVEEHREELEGMSVRETRALVERCQKLEARCDELEDDLKKQKDINKELIDDAEEDKQALQADLEKAEQVRLDLEGELQIASDRLKTADEEIARLGEELDQQKAAGTVTVHEPSEEQIAEIRKKALAEAKEKHKKELDKVKADADKEKETLEKIRAESEAQALREIAALKKQSDVHAQKVNFAMNALGRYLSDIDDEIRAMESEEAGSGVKLRMQCEAALMRLLGRFGWQV